MKTKWLGGITLATGLYVGLAQSQEQGLPTPTDLFHRHWAGIGGREVLEKFQSVTVAGTVQEGQEIREFTFQCKLPGLILLTTRDSSGKSTRQGRDPGARFWQQGAQGTQDLAEPGMGELAALSLAYLPATQAPLSERLAEAICETDRTGGRPVVAIGHKQAGGFPRFLFDAESGVLVGVSRARFEDYRAVEGVKVPYLVRQSGRSVFRVKTVQFNPVLSATVFERPGGRGGWLSQLSPGMQVSVRLQKQLSAAGRLEIVRRPPALHLDRGRLAKLPSYNPGSGSHGQVNLQNADLRQLDLSDRLTDLLHADFNGQTRWPTRLPA
ncbi:MAG TPA: hypothetical protein VNT26_07710, partial [Candidatus Sulfotelmatobacter sp.]|nr:hypothetical protein [Candidatus Sulfotelmatobacter sp.]